MWRSADATTDRESHSYASLSACLDIVMSKVGILSLGGQVSYPEEPRTSVQDRFPASVEFDVLPPNTNGGLAILILGWACLESLEIFLSFSYLAL